MTVLVQFAADRDLWSSYEAPLAQALADAGVAARVTPDAVDPATVDYLVTANASVVDDFRAYTKARAVLNLWAGVEKLVGNPTLTQPIARMVDPAMTEAMTEYVVAQVMRHHLGLDRHVLNATGDWRPDRGQKLARERDVTILGLGELGQAAAAALGALNFRVTGWSRQPRFLPGALCLAGIDRLDEALSTAEILVILLPLTSETENLLDAARLARLPRGAVLINAARGPILDDAALIAALDAGNLDHATLDVFRQEPLPAGHPFWAHPRVTVTPHIAAETRPATAARVIAENIRRGEAGEPLLHLVDRSRAY